MTQSSFSRLMYLVGSHVTAPTAAHIAAHIAAGVLALCAIVGPVQSQTRFNSAEPDTKFENYTTVEECIAVITRVRRYLILNQPLSKDMVQPHLRNRPELAATLIQNAEQCSRTLDSSPPPLTSWRLYAEMYLSARRETDARAVFDRRMAQVEADRRRVNPDLREDSVYSAVIDTMMEAYLTRRPDRVFSDTRLLEEWLAAAIPYAPRSARLDAMFEIARLTDDSVRMQWAATQIVHVASRLGGEEKNTEYFQRIFAPRHHRALEYLTFARLIDSLRIGTASWIAVKRENWRKVDARHTAPMNPMLGSVAQPFTGQFWFDSTGSVAPHDRPARGRPALVVFLSHECREGVQPPELKFAYCWETYSVLRRIAARFPTLDITIVAQSLGYFWPKGPMPPANEAEFLRQWFLEYHKLPGTLVINAPNTWFLENPDGRRILEPEVNGETYGFGQRDRTPATSAFLLDRDGVVVESEALLLRNEHTWMTLVDVLLKRQEK